MVALLWMCSRSGRVGSGVGYSDICIHLYVCSGQFFGFKILNYNTFGVFRKTNIFLGYEGGGGGHHKIGLYLGVISMHFMDFSSCQSII